MGKKVTDRRNKSRSQLTKVDKAAIKEEQAAFIAKIELAQPNEHQSAIYAAAQSGIGRYVVLAGPGSGKTFTSIKMSTRFAGKSIYFSYNKKIQMDTNDKLVAIDSSMVATTAHAFGLSCLIAYLRGGGCKVDGDEGDDEEKKYQAIVKQYLLDHWYSFVESIKSELEEDEETDVEVIRVDAKAWTLTLIHYAMVSLTDPTPAGLAALVDDFDLEDISPASLAWSFVCAAVPVALEQGMKQFLGPEHRIAFDDMIYLPNVIEGIPIRKYDHVIVDEAQDTSRASLELMLNACHADSQVFFVGDPRQCQPAGTMVRLKSGEECPIECLSVGDQVVTFDRRSAAFVKSGVVSDIAAREYDGLLYTIMAGERQSRCTDSHKWLVRWVGGEDAWVTYLMRRGNRYRVGQTKLFRNAPSIRENGQLFFFGLADRGRVERADAAWVLKVHQTYQEALVYEQIVSATYGLPEVSFKEATGGRSQKQFTQEMIDYIYDSLPPLEDRAKRCLEDHGRKLSYPLYTRNAMNGLADVQQRQGRMTLFETQACNLISGCMAVPVAPEDICVTHDKLNWQTIDVRAEPYLGVVYSLNIERHHKYVSDGLVTCNSIYAFAGADFDSIHRITQRLEAEPLPLRICYRCGSAIVDIANQLCAEDEKLISAGLHTGKVEVIAAADYIERLVPGRAAVIGRTTKRLVQGCLKVLQTGRKAKVLGKNLGVSIAAVVTRIGAMRARRGVPALNPDLSNFLELLSEHKTLETKSLKESRQHPEMAIAELEDKVETCKAFFTAYVGKCYDPGLRVPDDPVCAFNKSAKDFKTYIRGLFSDDENSKDFILFMTAHRSKGGEWEDVFIIGTDEFPHPRAKSDRQHQQEQNLMYVAVTRAIENLYFVGAPFDCLTVPGYEPERGLTIVSFPAADHLEIHPAAAVSIQEDGETVKPSIYDVVGFEDYDPDVVATLFNDNVGLPRSSTDFRHDEIEAVIDVTSVVESEVLVPGKFSRVLAIEVLCPACNGACVDPATGSLSITYDLVGHTVNCSVCRKACIVPLNAFSLQGDVVAREKPTGVTNNKREKKGRTQKERKAKSGRKTKGGTVRQPMQLSLNIRTINTLNAMGVNKSELFEDLLQQYEPFLSAWSELGNEEVDEDDDADE